MATVVGQDYYGSQAVKELADAGVDCRLVEQRAGYPTPLSFILANRITGSRTIINRKLPVAGAHLTRQSLHGLDPQLLLFDGHELEASLRAHGCAGPEEVRFAVLENNGQLTVIPRASTAG